MNSIGKRILGIVLLCLGIGIAVWLKNAHDSGGSIENRAVIFAPMLILYGGLSAVAPDMFLVRGEWAQASGAKKLINVVVMLIGLGIGLFLRFSVFSAWK